MLEFNINLKDSSSQLNRKINDAIIKKLRTVNGLIISNIKPVVRSFLRVHLEKRSKTIQSLLGNTTEPQLDAEFGIPKSQKEQRVQNIIDTWLEGIEVGGPKNIKNGNQFQSIYTFSCFRSDWSDVLSLEDGVTLNFKDGQLQDRLPWLEWLLVGGGDNPQYAVEYGVFNGSRSGKAIMKLEGSWRVPAEYAAGSDNFIDREVIGGEQGLLKNKSFMIESQKILTNAIKRLPRL